ncbi:LysR family transcriptional regulator [Xenophilus arseniciresistens]|uniref:LysR family transcriptional regulator n=1 Tax=Xenophilus arseniciresistens TaxID=1283306 RepID=A0AAE3N953_9BURK|nr:LysR family transcriptional regulator [Xenophilus arseniciresistens]MDA7416814.1 LysR family transcriptional regulator [Xenophilus arseniciresistens]
MRLKDIDLNLLVAFDALMRECHVTRAAYRLEISQSSMSLALAKLRTLFQDPLLIKSGSALQPTVKARNLAPAVEQVLNSIDRLVHEEQPFDPAHAQETVSMIVIDYIDFVVMPQLASALQQAAPDVRLNIVGPNPRRLGEVMTNGEIDLALSYFPSPPDSVRTRPLFNDRLVGVARTGHPMLQGPLTLEGFCAQRHVAVEPAAGATMYNALVDDALRRHGRERQVALSKPTFLGVPFIVAQSDLIAMMPERVALKFRALAPVTLFEPPFELEPLTINLMWHDRTHNNTFHRWLRGLITQVCGDIEAQAGVA